MLAAAILAWGLLAHPRDSQTTFDLLKHGRALSAADADKLEQRVKKKPDDEEARIQLLSYYAAPPDGADLSTVKAARLRHILWLVKKDPKDGLGLFHVSTGVYRLHCVGDSLADPEAFQRVSEMWLEQLRNNPESPDVRREAVDAIRFCSPDQAEPILAEAKDQAGLGRLYASAALGITGQSYLNGDPAGSDPAFRQRPFAAKARKILEEAQDRDLLVAAARTLLREGAILWADGKLDWDYTPLGNSLLARAKSAAPGAMELLTLPTALPASGERPPGTLRIAGNVQAEQIVQQVPPAYPRNARDAGIEGTVHLNVLIGPDGRILYVAADGGPAELIPASVEAVRQWQYKPTLLNGKPCYVQTRIDVSYRLPAR